ncbi:MAG: DUF3568 family protein [Pseudomonadota bacterium]|jgi:hypothetical protein|nr:DUF3568 family protein [Syntrophaceae bacterium]MBP7033440.1 DUF3568 family protein [Syntrophobacterales bacterium]MDI9556127.1 DUF3568 family protein [Pseudomonadota bacterium]NLX31191.1 DUF3568 family protein [Deltaproteobacteria bacterium]HNU85813.1 DUF3568 family protein [Syntrophales bacterium]
MIHRKRAAVALILLAGCFAFYGCPVLVVTGAAVAGGTGTYYYVEGELRTDYYFPVPGVWSAVEKTIADMKGRDVEPDRQTDGGKITAVINDEKVTFRLKYKDKDLTTLGIRVGLVGNETASKMLHDRVADHLLKK